MNTDTLNDRMMMCSNGPAVSSENTQEIHVIVDLTFEHWSQALTRIPSRIHQDVNDGGSESAESGHVGGDDDESEDDESHIIDLHENRPAQENLIDIVSPFITPTSWIV